MVATANFSDKSIHPQEGLKKQKKFLNQARAGRRPARAWFREITSMRTSVCVCMCVCVCLCVCVSAPQATKYYWRDLWRDVKPE